MKLKLKEKELPPTQLRLVLPASLKGNLDQYLAFVRETSGREVEYREVAVEMLAQFIESDHEFKRWQRRDQKPAQIRGKAPSEKSGLLNGHASA